MHKETRRNPSRLRKSSPRLKSRRLNSSPLSKSSDRSPSKKKIDASKSPLRKEDRQYQRFVRELKRDIHTYLDQCLQESRFDTRPGFHPVPVGSKVRSRPCSKLSSHRGSETGTYISSVPHPEDPISKMKKTERKRLAADVDAILKGPSLKMFYNQFIEKSSIHSRSYRSKVNSNPQGDSMILWEVSENLI